MRFDNRGKRQSLLACFAGAVCFATVGVRHDAVPKGSTSQSLLGERRAFWSKVADARIY